MKHSEFNLSNEALSLNNHFSIQFVNELENSFKDLLDIDNSDDPWDFRNSQVRLQRAKRKKRTKK